MSGQLALFGRKEELAFDATFAAAERVELGRGAWLDDADAARLHPVLGEMRVALDAHYGERFERLSTAWYRDGNDSVAWHGDHVARNILEALVATVSLGAPRKFLVRPKGGGPSQAWSLGWGDLVVMGGTCQRTWDHAIPKVAHADPRMVVMYRPDWESPRQSRITRA